MLSGDYFSVGNQMIFRNAFLKYSHACVKQDVGLDGDLSKIDQSH